MKSQSRSARRSRSRIIGISRSRTSFPSRLTRPGSSAFELRSVSCRRPGGTRFESQYGLSAYDANVLVEQGQDVADYFDAVAQINRGIQAGEQLDSTGRAQDDQGEETVPG